MDQNENSLMNEGLNKQKREYFYHFATTDASNVQHFHPAYLEQ